MLSTKALQRVPMFLVQESVRNQTTQEPSHNSLGDVFLGQHTIHGVYQCSKDVCLVPDDARRAPVDIVGLLQAPIETPVRVPSGQRLSVAISASVGEKGPAGNHRVGVKLVAADGTVECEREAKLEYLGDLRRAVLKAVEDTYTHHSSPAENHATSPGLNVDGGDRKMGDHHHSIAYLRFHVAVGGKPVSAVLRLYNAGNPSGDSGQVRLVAEPWSEKSVTYEARPKLGDVVAKIGPVVENQIVELPLELSLEDNQELSLAIDPTSCDGINYISREGGKPAELVVEYVK